MKKQFSNLDIQFNLDNVHFQILNIAFERFEHPVPTHSHGARSYEIHYVPIGFGRAEIDGTDYEITPGTLYITGPHVAHQQTPRPDNPMGEYCIYLTCSAERESDPAAGEPGSVESGQISVGTVFLNTPFWFGKDTQNLNYLMRQLFFELEHRLPGYKEQTRSLMIALIVSMVRSYKRPTGIPADITTCSLDDIKAFLIDNYFLYEYKNLSLVDLAQRLSISPRQTERFLNEYYGKTFLQKKNESRMSAARILLSDRSLSITSISEELGYSSIEHFSKAFKHYNGFSPRQYRSQL